MTITPISAAGTVGFQLDGKPVHGAQAVVVDLGTHRMVYTSGQVAPSGPDGRGDIETQVHAVLAQLQKLIEAAGGQMTDIAKLMAWTPKRAHIATYATIRRDYISHSPASTTLVAELVEDDILIEVEAIAVIQNAG